MNKNYNWILMDNNNQLCNFYLDENNSLMYRIKDEECWINKGIIDKDIIEFAVNYDLNNDMHIIYVCNNKLKYCIIHNNNKVVNTIYDFNKDHYIIKEIKLVLIGEIVYIFCLTLDVKSKNGLVLMNYVWDRKKVIKLPICIIKQNNFINNYYDVKIIKNKGIYVFYIDKKDNKYIIFCSIYKNNKWNEPFKVYEGDNKVKDYFIMYNEEFLSLGILNEVNGKIKVQYNEFDSSFKILKNIEYISRNEIKDYVIVNENKENYLFWIEKDKLIVSSLKEDTINPIIVSNTHGLVLYNYINRYKKDLKAECIYGIYPPDKLFLPSDIYGIDIEKENNRYADKKNDKIIDKSIEKIKNELEHINILRNDIDVSINEIKKRMNEDKNFIDNINNKLKLLINKEINLKYNNQFNDLEILYNYERLNNEFKNKIDNIIQENKIVVDKLSNENQKLQNEINELKDKIETEHDYFEKMQKRKSVFGKMFKS